MSHTYFPFLQYSPFLASYNGEKFFAKEFEKLTGLLFTLLKEKSKRCGVMINGGHLSNFLTMESEQNFI